MHCLGGVVLDLGVGLLEAGAALSQVVGIDIFSVCGWGLLGHATHLRNERYYNLANI
jgi:hypothetical protein